MPRATNVPQFDGFPNHGNGAAVFLAKSWDGSATLEARLCRGQTELAGAGESTVPTPAAEVAQRSTLAFGRSGR